VAADNYSDVVQALAQQIIEACLQTIRKNLPSMVGNMRISAEQIDGEVTSVNTSSLIIDPGNIEGLNQYVANMIGASRINPSQIATINPDDGKLYLNDVNIRSAQVADLEAQYATLWVAEINKAEIQTALIDVLKTSFAEIADARIGSATIDAAQITALSAVSAEIANLLTKNANIDYAQIKDLSAGTAIIEKGLNGKLYVSDLAVTEANMVSLTVGELVVKGQDGGFYAVTVDEDGNITAEHKTIGNADLEYHSVTGDKIQDNTIYGDTKMVESSITARTLNVQDIFADNAMVLSLIARNINVNELFANQAFIDKLNTTDISSNTYLQLAIQHIYDETMEEVSIRLSDDAIISTVTGSREFSGIINQRTRQTVTAYYAVSDDGQEPPEEGWETEIPEVGGGEYLWTKTVTEYANGGAPSVVYHVTQFGSHGGDGIVVRITSDMGFNYREPEGEMTLTAEVYAGGSQLSHADVNVLGGIQWFKDGVRVTGSSVIDWQRLVIDLSTVGERAVYRAVLMG